MLVHFPRQRWTGSRQGKRARPIADLAATEVAFRVTDRSKLSGCLCHHKLGGKVSSWRIPEARLTLSDFGDRLTADIGRPSLGGLHAKRKAPYLHKPSRCVIPNSETIPEMR